MSTAQVLALPSGVTIDNTLGAVLVGFASACVVYGILITQVFNYFSRYPSDRVVYKFSVRVYILAVAHDSQSARSSSSCWSPPSPDFIL